MSDKEFPYKMDGTLGSHYLGHLFFIQFNFRLRSA